jgi:hypothetical protein
VERLQLPDPELRVGGRRVACTTQLGYLGPYQLALASIVPDFAIELHSGYLGHPDGHTAVTHLQLRPRASPVTLASERPGAELPVREARRLCLYDHLAVLRDLLAEATQAPVTLELAESAFELIDTG